MFKAMNPLINPKYIDLTIKFFKKNKFEIVVPHIDFSIKNKNNIVKLQIDQKNKIHWMTRADSPHGFVKNTNFHKHLSIIVFTFASLKKYSKLKVSKNEKIESIELLRAIENNMELGSNKIKSDSFSIDILEDYFKANKYFKKDKIKLKYL